MHRARRLAIAVAVAAAAPLSGCGSSGSSTVSPSHYMASVCGAIGPWVSDVDARSSALSPTAISDPPQRKRAAQQFLSAVVIDTQHVLARLRAAGVPDVKGGKGIAASLVSVFTQLRRAFGQASVQAAQLPTANSNEYNQAAERLRNSIRASTASTRNGLAVLRNPQLEQAAVKQPACRAIGA